MNVTAVDYWIQFCFENKQVVKFLDDVLCNHTFIGYIVGITYLCSIFLLQRWMRERSAFRLKYVAILWNATLLLLNMVSTVRMAPHFIELLKKFGFFDSLCLALRGWEEDIVHHFWMCFFPFVKIIELGDTFLIVLQKRFLATYYWTHHFGALVVSWYLYMSGISIISWLSILIAASHIPIYLYALLKSMGLSLPRFCSTGLIVSEAVHMFWVMLMCCYMYYVLAVGDVCLASMLNVTVCMFIYTLCFVLSSLMLYMRLTSKSDSKLSEHKKSSTLQSVVVD